MRRQSDQERARRARRRELFAARLCLNDCGRPMSKRENLCEQCSAAMVAQYFARLCAAGNRAQTAPERAGGTQLPPEPRGRAGAAGAHESGAAGAGAAPRAAGCQRNHPRGDAAGTWRAGDDQGLPWGGREQCPGDRGRPRRAAFDSRPVADAAASGNREDDLHVEPSPQPHAPVVSSLRAARKLRADQHQTAPREDFRIDKNPGAARPAPAGAKEIMENHEQSELNFA